MGIRESSIEVLLGKSSELGALFRAFLVLCIWTIFNWLERSNIWTQYGNIHERCWFRRTDIILWPCLFGLYSTRMSNKQGYSRQLPKYVRIQDFCWSWGKTISFREIGCEYFSSWSCDMEVMQRSAWKDVANWHTKQLNSCTKSQHHALTTITLKKKKWDLLENCMKFAHRLFWNVYILACIGRLDILWSINKLVRAVTKWTKACDKRLPRLISYIHHQCEYSTTMQNRIVSGFWFCRDPEDSKSTSGEFLCFFWKSKICANMLDVQETDFCFTFFYTSWGDFFSMQVYAWMGFPLSIFGT